MTQAWKEDRFSGQVRDHHAPADAEGKPTGATHQVAATRACETSLEALQALKPVARENGVHTAGSSSQISDGGGRPHDGGEGRGPRLHPIARIGDTCLVGVDPVLMLTGPIDATTRLLERTGLSLADIDTVEINEAFASVVLAWAKELGADMATVNPNGGAIALGHPLGATGCVLLTKALYELQRVEGRYGLVTMCCGGGLGTGTIIERI
jgi:acetyl-CoA C-acetyltransferase